MKTKSGELEWTDRGHGLYTSRLENVKIRLYSFQLAVRGPSNLILETKEGYTKQEMREPLPHISAVPLGKMLYVLASVWNYITPSPLHFFVPKEPQTAEEKENEKLRLALQDLYKTVSEQF